LAYAVMARGASFVLASGGVADVAQPGLRVADRHLHHATALVL